MVMLFSPYSFVFILCYFMFMFSLLMVDNFYYYWGVMELLMLLFMGVSYTLFVSSYSQLMTYFLLQALSSFLILIFYLYNLDTFLTLAFLLKLSMFPFFTWYVNLIYRFPNFMFWLASTLHKVPAMLMIKVFSLSLNISFLWVSIIATVLLSGVMMLSVVDFRMVLVLSSIGNNSWFILSQMVNTFVFFMFIFTYSLSLYFVITSFGGLSKFSFVFNSVNLSYFLSFWVLSLSGMPPFPLFYLKMATILLLTTSLGLNYLFFIFLIFNALMVMGYLQSLMKYYIYVYSSMSHYLFKY